MRKIFLVLIVILSIHNLVISQVSKSDVQMLLDMNDTGIEKIKNFFVGNIKKFYKTKPWEWSYTQYTKHDNEYKHEYIMEENGFVIKVYLHSDLYETHFFPYLSIKKIYISSEAIDIYLKE